MWGGSEPAALWVNESIGVEALRTNASGPGSNKTSAGRGADGPEQNNLPQSHKHTGLHQNTHAHTHIQIYR